MTLDDQLIGYLLIGLAVVGAAAVVAALATRFGIAKERLTPVGVSFASPVAPNIDEDSRAKNRRVELVDNSAK